MTIIKSDGIKSIHIKEFWPYEYKAPDRSREAMSAGRKDRANARRRERYKAQKLEKLRVFEMNDDICERLNNGT